MSPPDLLTRTELATRLDGLSLDQLRSVAIRLDLDRDFSLATVRAAANDLTSWAASYPAHQRLLLEAVEAVCGTSRAASWQAWQWRTLRWLKPLGLRTGDGRPHILLSELFVDLELSHRAGGLAGLPERDERPGRFGPARAHEGDRALAAADDLDAALAALAADSHNRRIAVLVGAPGSGKTTLLHHRFVTSFESPVPEGPNAECVEPTLRPGQRQPVLLRCSTLDRHGLSGTLKRGDLARWAEAAAGDDGYPGAGTALLANRNGRALVLLDGYDELVDRPLEAPEPEGPRTTREQFTRWLAGELDCWPGSLFVLTTRKPAWEADRHGALDARAADYALLGLTQTARDTYVRRYFPKVAESEVTGRSTIELADIRRGADAQASSLLKQIIEARGGPDHNRVAHLAGNPLLLSIICLVFRDHGRLPQRRGDLYGRCYEVLVRGNRETAPDGHTGGRLGFEPDVGIKLLGPLAWAMQAAADAPVKARELESAKELPRAQALAILEQTRDADPKTRGVPPGDLLAAVVKQTGLLLEPDPHTVVFAHLTFQEYLAYEHARKSPGKARWLGEQAGEPRWREPILLGQVDDEFRREFYTGLLGRPGAAASVKALMEVCALEKEPPAGPLVDAFERATRPDPDPPPWWRFWERPEPAPARPTPADLAVLLGLYSSTPPREVAEAARLLREHPDEAVRTLAARLRGEEGPTGEEKRRVIPVLGLELVPVPAGSFLMGATKGPGPGHDPDAYPSEGPPHPVRIRQPFWLGRFPVTNAQYRRYVEAEGRPEPVCFRREGFSDPQMPVTGVSWEEAEAFCAWASGLGAGTVRLPTEAEWEWAARGEQGRRYPWGTEPAPSLERAWYGAYGWDAEKNEFTREAGEHTNQVRGPAPVGQRPLGAASCGAEELAGNVWEWCQDGWRDDYQPDAEGVVDPCAPAASDRVVRGGAWDFPSWCLRCSDRDGIPSGGRDDDLGFRVVCVPAPEPC